ncbi:hypothetical protein [Halobacillus sp. A5]|uniref:hypothetical protein n=1 Tax=Halobacillus sp. A5 TaxID=2880263 RepID=UPI0020A6A17D|nr:hypothetical protein [Halobacillus sp. A5]MCP3026689.1 hypothetical protein [Halobacillus sp. A5]
MKSGLTIICPLSLQINSRFSASLFFGTSGRVKVTGHRIAESPQLSAVFRIYLRFSLYIRDFINKSVEMDLYQRSQDGADDEALAFSIKKTTCG